MLLLAAIASAVLILSVSFDAFKGRTALAKWQFARQQAPIQFWSVLAFYVVGAVVILFAGIASVVPDCTRLPDGRCNITIKISESQP